MVKNVVRKEGIQLDHVAVTKSSGYSMKPCQLILSMNIDRQVYKDLVWGLSEIKFIF